MKICLQIPATNKYVIACSFGPDSMALFDMLIKGGYDFEVAHVNYGLREEAKKETEDLLNHCKKNNIDAHVCYVKEKIESNIEEKCRENSSK